MDKMNVYTVYWDASQATVIAKDIDEVPILLNERIRSNKFYLDTSKRLYFKWEYDDETEEYAYCEVTKVNMIPQVIQIVIH